MRAFVRSCLDESPLAEIDLLFFAEIAFRACHGLLFSNRNTGVRFRQRVMKGMERTLRFEDYGKFLGMAVTEEASEPQCAGHLGGIDFVEFVYTDAPAEKLVHKRVGRIDQHGAVMKGARIEAALPKDFVGMSLRRFCIDGKFQVIADRRLPQPPGERATGDQADNKE